MSSTKKTPQINSQKTTSNTNSKLIVLGLFCLALLVRLFYLYEIKSTPFFNVPQIDALFHDNWAQELLAGDWLSNSQGVFYKAPLYPYLLAIIYKIFGHGYFVIRLLQLTLGTVSCWFVYLLGKEYFDQRVAYISFFIAALYGTAIYFEGEMEIVAVHIFLNLLLLICLTKARQTGKNLWWILSGLTLGLSALVVPTILLFIPFILHWMCWDYYQPQNVSPALKKIFSSDSASKAKPEHSNSARTFWIPAILLLASTFLIISPATIHNYIHEKKFVLISANGGLNFYLGNNLNAEQTTAIRPGIVWDHFTAQPHVAAGHHVSRNEENDYWSAKSLKYINNNPAHFIKGLFKKLGLFWQAYEIKRNKDLNFFKRYSFLLKLPLFGFGLIAPLALLGIGLSCIHKHRKHLLLFYVISVMSGVILFFVTARYRLSAVPVLILYAAYALTWLWDMFCQNDYQPAVYALACLIIATGLINYDFWDLEKNNKFARSYHNLGFIYANQQGSESTDKTYLKKAIENWEKAITLYAPGELGAVDTHYYLAKLYLYELKEYKKAIEHCEQGLKVLPDMAELETELGWAYYQLAILDSKPELKTKGIESLIKAIKSDPWYQKAYVKLGDIYTKEGRYDKAQKIFGQAQKLIKGEDRQDTLTRLTNIFFKQGLLKAKERNWQEAEKLFKITLDINQNFGNSHYNLGLVYLNNRQWKLAVKHLERATQLKPDKGEAFGALGSAYLVTGQKDKAREMFKRALEINPKLELARQELERLGR